MLPRLLAVLAAEGAAAVLQAPPGAGKTTRVPLALLASGRVAGRILLLEPRRLAARAAAERMAEALGEPCGRTVGYRMRGEARVSAATRIEVLTEGILTRLLQRDPGLEGVGAVIFDEFHERSLEADLGLALTLEARAVLRPDLRLLVMSATLDAAPVAALIGAPVLTAEGRAFPVETRWLPRPLPPRTRIEAAVAEAVLQALPLSEGGILAFLPGEAEIRRCEALLRPRLPPGVALHPLYGALPAAAQRAALAPAAGRKLVLATAIAETSLTIEGIRAVVDGGLARRAVHDPGSGLARLVTVRVSRAEAEQRRGRAGRVAAGQCWRLWTRGEEGALAAQPPPGIATADLTGLALELALWGSADLPFLTPPPEGALAEARALLGELGALDGAGRITAHGRRLAALPLHPRLAHMLLAADPDTLPLAARLAALLEARDPLRRAGTCELDLRLALLADPARLAHEHGLHADPGTVARLRQEATRLVALLAPLSPSPSAPLPASASPDTPSDAPAPAPLPSPPPAAPPAPLSAAQLAALAYPDRIALRRPGEEPRYLLSGGKGARIDPADPLAAARLLVVTDTDGASPEARIRLALPLSEAELRQALAPRLRWRERVEWSRREDRLQARQEERLGALVLATRPWPGAPAEALARAALDGLRQSGLHWSPAARRLAARMALVAGMPAADEAALLEGDALLPWLGGCRTRADLQALDLLAVLQGMLGPAGSYRLEAEAPSAFTTPAGRRVPIDYEGGTPQVAVRLQEMFGPHPHPRIGRQPLKVTLLSPAGRPLQVTTDLPGFWAGAYAEVRKEMRGRYPRHPWPEDPLQASPTLRARPRPG